MEEQDQQSEQAVEAVEQQTDAQVADNVGETAAAESSVENAATANSDKNDKGKKGHGLVLVLVAVLVLVLAAGCVAAVVLLQGSGDKKDDSQRADNKQKQEPVDSDNDLALKNNELSDFDLSFLKLENNEENNVYSPLSVKYALAMLKDGAKGESKKQIENVIGGYEVKKYTNSKNTSLANAMFIREETKDKIIDSYIDGLKTNYNADVIYDSFKSASAMNSWINKQTLGLIDKTMKDEDLKGLDFALVNALAIDQNWNYALQCQDGIKIPCKSRYSWSSTYEHEDFNQSIDRIGEKYESLKFNGSSNVKSVKIGANFNNYDIIKELGEDKIRTKVTEEYKKWLRSDEGQYEGIKDTDTAKITKKVDEYMEELKANYGKNDSSTDYYVYYDDDVKVFAKDLKKYDGNTLQYVGIMPKEDSLSEFVKSLTAKKTAKYIDGLKELKNENFKEGVITRIDATIPLFKYDGSLNLKDDLKALGIEDVFSEEDADLSGVTKLTKANGEAYNSFIKIAKHNTTIDFSNEGIKASATTVLGGGIGAGGPHFEYLWDVPVEKVDLTFDKPFMYLIRNKDTGEIWFVGTVYEPTENKE